MNKTAALSYFLTLLCAGLAQAGETIESRLSARTEVAGTPLDLFRLESSYVFKSDIDDERDDFNLGEQDAFQLRAEYSHRFHLTGNLYLRAGAAYERFEFGDSFAPVPDHLHSIAAIFGVDYMRGKDTGAFLQLRPGFYTESDIDSASFDVPITLGRVFVLQEDRLYLFVGATAAFLRGEYPILPIAGVIWKPNEQWNVFAMLPEPRVSYSPTKNFDLWLGGQLVGSSFRTNENRTIFPRRLDHAVVDYTEYRVGGGFVYRPSDEFSIDIGGGYVIERRFNFERADEEFTTDPAPYVRVSLKAEF